MITRTKVAVGVTTTVAGIVLLSVIYAHRYSLDPRLVIVPREDPPEDDWGRPFPEFPPEQHKLGSQLQADPSDLST